MLHYIALIHKDAGSDYGVSFPDLPGCTSAGKDLEEASVFAEEALALHLAGLREDDMSVRPPSSLDAIMRDPENRFGLAILVPVKVIVPGTVQVDITLSQDILAKIDAHAKRLA